MPSWRHAPSTLHKKGRMRITCSCGWQTPGWIDHIDAVRMYRDHAGLKEKETPHGSPRYPT